MGIATCDRGGVEVISMIGRSHVRVGAELNSLVSVNRGASEVSALPECDQVPGQHQRFKCLVHCECDQQCGTSIAFTH